MLDSGRVLVGKPLEKIAKAFIVSAARTGMELLEDAVCIKPDEHTGIGIARGDVQERLVEVVATTLVPVLYAGGAELDDWPYIRIGMRRHQATLRTAAQLGT